MRVIATSPFRQGYKSAWIPLCLLAVILAFFFTRHLQASFDSYRYANLGSNIIAGRGLTTSVVAIPLQHGSPMVEPGLHDATVQPPGLGLFYAAVGIDRRVVAQRWLHLLCFPLLAWLVFRIGTLALGSRLAAFLVTLATITNPYLLKTVGYMWTDLPFTTAFLATLLAVLEADRSGRRALPWMLGASAAAACAALLRYPGMSLGFLFLADAGLVLANRGVRRAVVRLAAGLAIFGPTCLWLIVRNIRLAGSYTGVSATSDILAPGPSLVRGFNMLVCRAAQLFTPGSRDGRFQDLPPRLFADHPHSWIPLGTTLAVLAALIVFGCLRRNGWPRGLIRAWTGGHVTGLLILALAGAYLGLFYSRMIHHAELQVMEIRYLVPVLALVWLPAAWVLLRRRWFAAGLTLLVLVTVINLRAVPGDLPRPKVWNQRWMRSFQWVDAHIPADVPILTNNADGLLELNVARRIYKISTWHFKQALPPALRTETALRAYLQAHGIGYVVLFSAPRDRGLSYWGPFIISLLDGKSWPDDLVYADGVVRVYRVPTVGATPGTITGKRSSP